MRRWARALALPLTVWLLSSALAAGGFWWGDHRFRHWAGYQADRPMVLGAAFRFDSSYYEDIAAHGYAFLGRCEASNVVFMPLYPLAVRGLSALSGLSASTAGALLSQAAFLAALVLIAGALRRMLGGRAALFVLAGLGFSTGSAFFHAVYSESVTLLGLALCLDAWQRRRPLYLAVAAGLLGAARPPAVAWSGAFALYFAWRAARAALGAEHRPALPDAPAAAPTRRRWVRAAGFAACAAICCSGTAAYLGYVQLAFARPAGFPDALGFLNSIQRCAWGRFYGEVKWWELLTFRHLWAYFPGLLHRPPDDHMSINYLWMFLGFLGAIWAVVRLPGIPLRLGFAGYFLFVYGAKAGSEYLNSSYRYFVLMLPIFLMVWDGFEWLYRRTRPWIAWAVACAVFGIDLFSMLLCAARLQAGRWFFF